jgi:ankyrin repeat protein
MNSLNKIVLLSVLSLCTAPAAPLYGMYVDAGDTGTQDLAGEDSSEDSSDESTSGSEDDGSVFSMDIFKAAKTGKVDRVRELIRQDPQVVNKLKKGRIPLHYAAFYGRSDTVELLLAHGAEASVNQKTKDGLTPLHCAAIKKGKLEVVKILLGAGAHVNIQSKDGLTPLHYAAFRNYLEVVRILLDHSANVTQQDCSGCTPLHYAAWNGHSDNDTVAELLAAGADVNQQDNDGCTPLHAAVYNGNPEIVRMLLGARADQSIVDKKGEYPLSLAVGRGKHEIAEILLDAIEIRARRMREIASTLALVAHSRLGEVSPAALLSQDLMADITRLSV